MFLHSLFNTMTPNKNSVIKTNLNDIASLIVSE